jgi:hypothetical protein
MSGWEIDCIMFIPIPPERLISIHEASAIYHFDIDTLTRCWIETNTLTNPCTTLPLSKDDATRVILYREHNQVKITVIDYVNKANGTGCTQGHSYNKHNNSVYIVDGSAMIGHVILEIFRQRGGIHHIVYHNLIYRGKSLFELPLKTEIKNYLSQREHSSDYSANQYIPTDNNVDIGFNIECELEYTGLQTGLINMLRFARITNDIDTSDVISSIKNELIYGSYEEISM